jgi:hypothetical protein
LKLLLPVFGAVLTALALDLKKLIQAHVKNVVTSGILARLDDFVLTVVLGLNQTVVDDLKSAQGGKLTQAQKVQVKNDALTRLKLLLGPQGLADLSQVLGLNDSSLEFALTSKLEAKVGSVAANAVAQAVSTAAGEVQAAVAGPVKAAGLAFGGVAPAKA